MKIYIMTDLEGVAGVINQDDYAAPGARRYDKACELTTLEVNAAIEGALAAGATEFLVADGHGHGAIEPSLLHPAAKLLAGRPGAYPFGCDDSFDAAFSIGQHAKSNADGGHLSHTGSFTVEDATINGLSVGELAKNTLFCSYFNVPMVFVSGDYACTEEAKALIPNIETVAVKWGARRGSATGLTGAQNKLFNGVATHLAPARAREEIRAGAERALQRRNEIGRFWLEPPYEYSLTLRPTETEAARTGTARSHDLIELLSAPLQF